MLKTNTQNLILNYIESHWHENHSVPSQDKLSEHFQLSPERVQEFFEDPLFREVLERKYLWEQYAKPENTLSARQLQCLNILANSLDRRTPRQKLKELKVTAQQFQVWLEEPAFAKALNSRVHDNFKSSAWRIKQAIVEEAASGDISAAKFFMELTGEYTPTSKSSVNVSVDFNRTVDLLIEVILRHVTPETAQRIGAEFEMVLSGRNLPSLPVPSPVESTSVPPVGQALVLPVESTSAAVLPVEQFSVPKPGRNADVKELLDFFTNTDEGASDDFGL